MAEVAAVDLRRAGEPANGRLRHLALVMAVLACALGACSDARHTVGVFDVNAVSDGTGGMRDVPRAGNSGSGGTLPIDDGSTGFPDAAIPDAAPQCADDVIPTERRRLNMYLLIDTNFLVTTGGEWDKVQQGILDYSRREEAEGTGLGLRLIDPDALLANIPILSNIIGWATNTPVCAPATYSNASDAVAEAPLPTHVAQLTSELTNVTASVTTPLGPALEGALALTFSWKNQRPDEEQVLVLLSDAFLDFSCGTTAEELAASAAYGVNSYGIRSYMIELLNPVPLLPDQIAGGTLIPLDPVAAAGGTGRARSFNLGGEDASVLADRLLEIQRDAEVCEYALPADHAWDEALLAVDTGVGPGPLARLSDASECGVNGGAYVRYVDPTNGTTWARACPTSCAAITASARAPMWIIGCDPSADGP